MDWEVTRKGFMEKPFHPQMVLRIAREKKAGMDPTSLSAWITYRPALAEPEVKLSAIQFGMTPDQLVEMTRMIQSAIAEINSFCAQNKGDLWQPPQQPS